MIIFLLIPRFLCCAQSDADLMNKRLISRLMHERVEGLRSSGVYFFRGDFDCILQGTVLEYVPRGIYVWSYKFPLFDFFGPNLTYSKRLAENPFIEIGEKSEEEVVEHVMSAPEVCAEFESDVAMSIQDFVRFVEGECVTNPHAKLMQAAALILLGQTSAAATLLKDLPPFLHPKDVPHCNQLAEALRSGEGLAKDMLQKIRDTNLIILGLA